MSSETDHEAAARFIAGEDVGNRDDAQANLERCYEAMAERVKVLERRRNGPPPGAIVELPPTCRCANKPCPCLARWGMKKAEQECAELRTQLAELRDDKREETRAFCERVAFKGGADQDTLNLMVSFMAFEKRVKELETGFLRIARGACLSDHMGDVWNTINKEAKRVGIEIPEDENGDADYSAILAALGEK